MAWFRFSAHEPNALEELASAVLQLQERAVAPFLLAIAPSVLRTVRQVLGRDHQDVEDVVQEALVGTLGALPGFRRECSVQHFVRRIALLTALNARRRLQLRQQIAPHESVADADCLPGRGPSPADAVDSERRRQIFATLLDELPAAQAEAIAMHCILGYSVSETASAAGVPENTVRGRLVAAKAALRKRLKQDGAFEELLRGVS